jgi:hypothetical protein
LICGLAVAAGNIASRRLGARFVLVSGSVVAHTLLDVPLSTTLLTNGFGLLILLWFVIPEELISGPAPVAQRLNGQDARERAFGAVPSPGHES